MVRSWLLGVELACLAFLPQAVFAVAEGPSLRGTENSDRQASQLLVFDAGSSGTRVHVFNLKPGQHVPSIDLHVREQQTKKIEPGLSSFAQRDDLPGVQENIERLLEFANQWVPAARRSSTPVLLKATAGLRAVDPERAQRVLQRVRQVISTSGYHFRSEWADIIQGKEEGGLAWIAANYLHGVFSDPSMSSSIGVIEMGGGSTQVTFALMGKTPQDIDSFSFSTTSGKVYKLYAHSYLGFGQDHAQAKVQQLFGAGETKDPCYPVGYWRPSREDATVIIEGTGNTEECQSMIRSKVMSLDAAPGKYGGELSPHGTFVGTENFYFPRKDLSLPYLGDEASVKDAARKGCKLVCGSSGLDCEEESKMKSGITNPARPNHCFGLSYHVVLLEALKNPVVEIKKQINGGDVDWAVGAAIKHFIDNGPNMNEPETEKGQMESIFQAMSWLLLAVFVVALAGGVVRFYVGSGAFSMKSLFQTAKNGGVLPASIGSVEFMITCIAYYFCSLSPGLGSVMLESSSLFCAMPTAGCSKRTHGDPF